MNQKAIPTESTPIVEKKWLQNNIFHLIGSFNGQVCTVLIGGSFENTVSQSFVDCLNLRARNNIASILFVGYLMMMRYKHTCQVTFTIAKDYKNTMWCDVLPMDREDILLGRSWMYNKNGIHGM